MTEQLFYELICVSLGTCEKMSRMPTAKEWTAIYEWAKKQSLVGVCFAGVQKLSHDNDDPSTGSGQAENPSNSSNQSNTSNLPELDYLRWMGMAAKIQQRNAYMDEQCVRLQKNLLANGFRTCVLKGQIAALRYGTLAGLRQSGDIDLWVDAPYKEVIRFAKSKDHEAHITANHVEVNLLNDAEVELHPTPSLMRCPWINSRLQRFFEEKKSDCFRNQVSLGDGTVRASTSDLDCVFMMVHMYEHVIRRGIGLRQLMDYFFLLKTEEGQKAKQTTMAMMECLGMTDFAEGVMYILHTVFGMEEELLLCRENPKIGSFILSEAMIGGNFGHYDDRDKMTSSSNALVRVAGGMKRSARFFRLGPWEVIYNPLWRLWHFCWMKSNGYR